MNRNKIETGICPALNEESTNNKIKGQDWNGGTGLSRLHTKIAAPFFSSSPYQEL